MIWSVSTFTRSSGAAIPVNFVNCSNGICLSFLSRLVDHDAVVVRVGNDSQVNMVVLLALRHIRTLCREVGQRLLDIGRAEAKRNARFRLYANVLALRMQSEPYPADVELRPLRRLKQQIQAKHISV